MNTTATHSAFRRLGFLAGLLALACLAFGAASAAAQQKITDFDATYTDAAGNPVTAAGSHPSKVDTTIGVEPAEIEKITTREAAKDLVVELPPGLVGNPQAIPQCDVAMFVNNTCAPEAQVGNAELWLGTGVAGVTGRTFGIANLGPASGTPAVLAVNVIGVTVYSYASLRSGDDYGVNINTRNITKGLNLLGTKYKLWGDPQSPSHDAERGYLCVTFGIGCSPSSAPNLPFISLPTSCGPMATRGEATGWPSPNVSGTASSLLHDSSLPAPNQISIDGCDAIDFTPTLDARPTTNAGDSASGLDVDLHTPQNEDPDGTAEAHLKDATVKLPEGLVINPSSANGLGSCSLSQIGFTGSTNETQSIDISGVGPFEITFEGQTTATIPGGAPASAVDAALEALPNLGPGDVSVEGGVGAYAVEFTGARAGQDVPLMSVEGVTDKVLELSGSGTFTLSYEGSTTGSLAFIDGLGNNSLAYEFEYQVNQLPSVVAAGGSVSVDGGEDDAPYYISLDGGSFSGTDRTLTATGASVSLTEATAAGLPISAEVTTTTEVGHLTFTPGSADCPAASRLASVEIETPLLDHVMQGSIYLAKPFENPFKKLIALYVTADDPQTGLFIKLAGHVEPDPATGQLTAVFDDNPQLPFEHLRLHFFGGPSGALRTPSVCGAHTTSSTLTPWSAPDSGPPVQDSDTWQITQNCAGSEAAKPNKPSFDAGTVSPVAKSFSPFVMHLRREDGSQNFSAVTVSPPAGLVAKLAGVGQCSEADLATAAAKSGAAEQAAPSCPAGSRIGSVVAGAGAGPAPYHAPGEVYMAGPYKGAPLSFAIVTPAVAGPFDLGTIVVRTALFIDPKTAKITAVSDPIPAILQGIPLDVRTIDLTLDRDQFVKTGSSCDAGTVDGTLTSTLGQATPLSSRFQLGECTRLGFKPKISLRLKGGIKRAKYPQLTAAITTRPGDANIASVSVAFPKSEQLENAHIRTVCTRPQWAADSCPPAAIYGESTVYTPILDYPLSGHVYMRSSDNVLPDLVPDLRGPSWQPIKIEVAGITDSIRGGLRTSFNFFPDTEFSRAELKMQGGKKGLLVNSRNICKHTFRATVKFTAHNGSTLTLHPKIQAQCKRRAG